MRVRGVSLWPGEGLSADGSVLELWCMLLTGRGWTSEVLRHALGVFGSLCSNCVIQLRAEW